MQPYTWKTQEWTRLVCFKSAQGQTLFGEPVFASDGSISQAKVLDENGHVTNKQVPIAQLLAPFEPKDIICIGLNYQRHAIESKLPTPQFPGCFH